MNILTEEQEKGWRTINIISFGIFIFCPVVYLIVVWLMYSSPNYNYEPIHNALLFYILLGLSILNPLIIPIMLKVNDSKLVNSQIESNKNTEVDRFKRITLIKGSVIIAIYLYGLAIFFMNHTIGHLWYFYAIGIFWTYIHFPRKSQYIEFIDKEQTNVVTN